MKRQLLDLLFGTDKKKKECVSIVNNPFKKSCITNIKMSMWKGTLTGDINIDGYVKFKNGATEGKQDFKASNLPELLMKIYKFCEELSDQYLV